MKIKKAIAGLASAIAMLGCIHTSAAADQLRFGIDPTFPPFESKNANGQLIGFDIDLGNAICAEMKVQCPGTEQLRRAYSGTSGKEI